MRVVLLLIPVGLLGACGSPTPEVQVPSEVTGVIAQVDRGDDEGIVGFTVEDGETYRIRIDPARDYGFDLEHLAEHEATGDPVRVTTETRRGEAYAVEILDA